MAHWLDTAIVGTTLLTSALFLVRLYRKKPAAGCGKGCGGCAAAQTPRATQSTELVQIGHKRPT